MSFPMSDSQRPLVTTLVGRQFFSFRCLALTLLVTRLSGADHSNNTFATNNCTIAANLFNRSSNFHFLSYPTSQSELV